MGKLADEIAGDMEALARDYPSGATLSDLAGYYGEPLIKIEAALADLRTRNIDMPFLSVETPKDAAAVALGRRGGAKRAERLSPDARSEIAQNAAHARWSGNWREEKAPVVEESVARLKQALPVLAQEFPFGVSAKEMADALNMPLERCYRALGEAEKEGWCELVKSYGNRITGRIAVFDGMLVPAPRLTDLQEKVLAWITARARPDGICEVQMNKCAADLGMTMINDKLDSMERKGFLARLTPYTENRLKPSPLYQVLDPPQPRRPQLRRPQANPLEALAHDLEERGYEVVGQEPIAIRRARDRRYALAKEMEEIDAFLATYERLSR